MSEAIITKEIIRKLMDQVGYAVSRTSTHYAEQTYQLDVGDPLKNITITIVRSKVEGKSAPLAAKLSTDYVTAYLTENTKSEAMLFNVLGLMMESQKQSLLNDKAALAARVNTLIKCYSDGTAMAMNLLQAVEASKAVPQGEDA